MIRRIIDLLSEKKNILILGFGKEGRSSYTFIREYFPEKQLCIADRNSSIASEMEILNDKFAKHKVGSKYLENIDDYDLIIKSPGIKINNITDKALFGELIDFKVSTF